MGQTDSAGNRAEPLIIMRAILRGRAARTIHRAVADDPYGRRTSHPRGSRPSGSPFLTAEGGCGPLWTTRTAQRAEVAVLKERLSEALGSSYVSGLPEVDRVGLLASHDAQHRIAELDQQAFELRSQVVAAD